MILIELFYLDVKIASIIHKKLCNEPTICDGIKV